MLCYPLPSCLSQPDSHPIQSKEACWLLKATDGVLPQWLMKLSADAHCLWIVGYNDCMAHEPSSPCKTPGRQLVTIHKDAAPASSICSYHNVSCSVWVQCELMPTSSKLDAALLQLPGRSLSVLLSFARSEIANCTEVLQNKRCSTVVFC